MSEEIAAYVRREIDELDHLEGRQYLQDIGTPKLTKYRLNGYAIYDCWVVSQIAEADLYLCVIVGQLSDVRYWGLLKYQNYEYSMASYVFDDLEHLLEDVEQMMEDD